MPSKVARSTLVLGLLALAGGAAAAPRGRLALRPVELPLPGPPATVIAADVDGDDRRDLAVVVARTDWSELGISEETRMDDVEGLVEVMTVVPALVDRRELHVFLARGDGYVAVPPLELGPAVLSLEAGPPGIPLLALTDDGLAAVRLADGALALVPLASVRSALARTRAFVPELGLVRDFDGDGGGDVLVPTADGAAVFRLDGAGALVPAPDVALPVESSEEGRVRDHVLPELRDVDGDRRPDLVVAGRKDGWAAVRVLRGTGEGRFASPIAPLGDGDEPEAEAESGGSKKTEVTIGTGGVSAGPAEAEENGPRPGRVVHFGDLDGDGVAEVVTLEELASEDAGFRQGLEEAKRPPVRFRLHRVGADLAPAAEPYTVLEAIGYAESGDGSDVDLPGGLQDLDGDGRLDLVTFTLDFSLAQAVRVMATKRISLGLEFHVYCQADDGSFRAVPGLDLSGRFRFDLDDLRLDRVAQFAGDFDGDGRLDFVQLGRGKAVTVHRGRDGCVYPSEPDLRIELRDEPRDLSLVQVRDLDGDALADLLVIQPQSSDEAGATAPVRLDLYLSGAAP